MTSPLRKAKTNAAGKKTIQGKNSTEIEQNRRKRPCVDIAPCPDSLLPSAPPGSGWYNPHLR
jgi:hypothetical protein